MHEKFFDQYKKRVTNCIESLQYDQYRQAIPLYAVMAVTKEPVPFKDRLELDYVEVERGDVWGETWQSGWMKVSAVVPKLFDGKELCLRINVGGEALVFDGEGCPAYSLTGMSVFSNLYSKDRMVIGRFAAGTKLEYWVECAANGLFGVNLPSPEETGRGLPGSGRGIIRPYDGFPGSSARVHGGTGCYLFLHDEPRTAGSSDYYARHQ